MIPFFDQPVLEVGPVTIHSFGALTALAVLVGLGIARRRADGSGLDLRLHERAAWYALGIGVLGAHLYSVFLYFPHRLAEDLLLLLRVWENISSLGGFLGGGLGLWVFFHRHRQKMDRPRRLRHLDALGYALPFAWAVGRAACTLAHDHPGRVTEFFLARSLETEPARDYITGVYSGAGRLDELPAPGTLAELGFHDLGWYEFLYLVLFVVPLFLYLDRQARRPGFWLPVFAVLYAPVRFLLDFLRVPDPTYWGFTPAQWGIAAVLAAGAVWLLTDRRFRATGAPGSRRRAAEPGDERASERSR